MKGTRLGLGFLFAGLVSMAVLRFGQAPVPQVVAFPMILGLGISLVVVGYLRYKEFVLNDPVQLTGFLLLVLSPMTAFRATLGLWGVLILLVILPLWAIIGLALVLRHRGGFAQSHDRNVLLALAVLGAGGVYLAVLVAWLLTPYFSPAAVVLLALWLWTPFGGGVVAHVGLILPWPDSNVVVYAQTLRVFAMGLVPLTAIWGLFSLLLLHGLQDRRGRSLLLTAYVAALLVQSWLHLVLTGTVDAFMANTPATVEASHALRNQVARVMKSWDPLALVPWALYGALFGLTWWRMRGANLNLVLGRLGGTQAGERGDE